MDNLDEMMPIIYTPTVGRGASSSGTSSAARGRTFPSGTWAHPRDPDPLAYRDIRVIVVTDGERILAWETSARTGWAFRGKLSSTRPARGSIRAVLHAVMLDCGTNNETLLNDPLYIGIPERRLRDQAYDDLVEEFFTAVQEIFPRACIQLEDFGNANAFRLLHKYKDRACTFDDDIQGTASVALAGSTPRADRGQPLSDHSSCSSRGGAGIGIGELVVTASRRRGCRRRRRGTGAGTWIRRDCRQEPHDLVPHNCRSRMTTRPRRFHGGRGCDQADSHHRRVRHARTFTRPVVEAMAGMNRRPSSSPVEPHVEIGVHGGRGLFVVGGRAIFASGSRSRR